MSPILFYGVPSGCSFGSIVALEWLGQPYRLCRVEMPGGFTPAYRRLNPVAETPALITADGRALAESMAILNHLAARGVDRGLGFPQGSRGYDQLNQMLAWLNTTFFSAFAPLWYALEHPSQSGSGLAEFGRSAVAGAHRQLEMLLGDRRWLLGGQRSLADAYFAGIARWADYHDAVDRRDYPNVQRLYEALQDDPGVAFAQAVEQGTPGIGSGGCEGHLTLDAALGELRQDR